jgi:hypothetical protein
VIMLALSLKRYKTASTTSATSPNLQTTIYKSPPTPPLDYLPKGILWSIVPALAGSVHHFRPISVIMTVGLTALTLIP